MRKFLAALFAFLLATQGGAAPAFAALIPGSQFSTGNWNGAGYTSDLNAKFSACVVGSTYGNGTTLSVAVLGDGGVLIFFMRPDWTVKKGAEIRGTIRIDETYSAAITELAVGPNTVEVNFAPADAIFGRLAHGHVLTVTSSAVTGVFILNGSDRALEMAWACARKYQAQLGAPAKSNPALQKWMALNPWVSDPRYAAQARVVLAINAQLIAEGKNPNTSAFYDEMNKRLRRAGISIPVSTPSPSTVAAATAPPQPATAPNSAKPLEQDGTAFVVSKNGYIVTNEHVIDGCIGDIHANLTGEPTITLRLVSSDEMNDLALLKASTTFPSAAAITGTAVHPGDSVIAIGYPYYGLLSSQFSVTTGIISSLGGVGNDSGYLQISAPIQPGNSGGPLLDARGDVVGVVAEKLNAIRIAKLTGSIPENLNFAIKTGVLRDFLDENAVNYTLAPTHPPLSTADIASHARGYILHISCTAKAD